MLSYYIKNPAIPWSRMFGIMEEAKRGMNIEDYSIGQTSLEQVCRITLRVVAFIIDESLYRCSLHLPSIKILLQMSDVDVLAIGNLLTAVILGPKDELEVPFECRNVNLFL
jgi:hypothetical protein